MTPTTTSPHSPPAKRRVPQRQQRGRRNIERRPAHPTGTRAPLPRHPGPIALTGEILRVVPLGGFEEVGRNMMILEYVPPGKQEADRLIIDMGLRFPEEDTPGIDFIIPNASYLKGKERTIRGIFITHGHYDHMGAIPYLAGPLRNPPIFATPLARGMILKRQEDFPHTPKLEIHTIDKRDRRPIRLGPFSVEPFHVNHNIPDSIGLAIGTPLGTVVHSCDFKFDFKPIGDEPADLQRIAEIGSRGILALLSDSTGVEHAGHSISESVIFENLDPIFREAPGRVIMSTFASLIGRQQQAFLLAEKYGRKVALEGYSMKANVEIAQGLGYLKIPKGMMMPIEDAERLDPKRTVILCTGAQGESNAALMRIANREHRVIRIREDDTMIFSSSIVPGNERSVQYLKDALARQGARIFHYKTLDIHASGHAYAEDLKLMLSLVKPKFLIPIHGQYSMLKAHAELGQSMGIPREYTAVGYNGAIIEFNRERIQVRDEQIQAQYVFVDGLGVGDVREVVLRDRQMMAQDGMFVIVAIVDRREGRVRGEPDVISRGFVYLRESGPLLAEARKRVKMLVEQSGKMKPVNWTYVRDNIREDLGKFFFQKTQRRPMVLPVIIEV